MSAPALPPSDPAPGRTPVPGGDGTPWERREPLRASLVADLTAAMGKDPISPFDVDEDTLAVFADRLVRAGWRRVTEDPPKPREFVVFDMEPDDVVLIGGVKGGVQVAERLMQWARTEWPDRKILLFTDDIDVRLLREFEDCGHPHCLSADQIRECLARAAVLRGGEQP